MKENFNEFLTAGIQISMDFLLGSKISMNFLFRKSFFQWISDAGYRPNP